MTDDDEDDGPDDDPGQFAVGGGEKKPKVKKPKPSRSSKRVPAIRVRRAKGKREKSE